MVFFSGMSFTSFCSSRCNLYAPVGTAPSPGLRLSKGCRFASGSRAGYNSDIMSRPPGLALAILFSALTLPRLVATQAPEPRFADELDVEVVNVDVVATGEDGMPVPGLT